MWRSRFPGVTPVLRASVAPFLLLFTPFVAYLEYQRHGLANPEVVIVMLLIAASAIVLGAGSAWFPPLRLVTLAALITFFADIQARDPGLTRLGLLFLASCAVVWVLRQHADRIVSVVMATLLALSILSPRFEAATSEERPDSGAPHARAGLPLILHLLLDEYIGPEGLPAELTPAGFKDARQSFFVDRGFRLFGKAYSEYPTTIWSVPQLLNLTPGRYVSGLTVNSRSGGYRLARNAYFERLARLGYSVKVHELDYLDLCPGGLPASCRTYPVRSLHALHSLDVPTSVKLEIVGGTFLGQSHAYNRLKLRYRDIRLGMADRIALPAWNWERSFPSPAATMPIFDALAADLSKAQPGTFLFAHILLPHHPYIYDSTCRQRPEPEWLIRSDADRVNVAGGITNVPEGRAARYAAYFQQVVCTERKIQRLLDAIPPALRDEAIVVVHGDHGSRITLVDPTTVTNAIQSLSDYADAFSTMFAVRSRGIESGYDTRMTPITCLLRTLVDSGFQSTSGIEACSSPNTVFFDTKGKGPAPRPLPDFATAKTAAPASVKRERVSDGLPEPGLVN
jgi:hypothetical protein